MNSLLIEIHRIRRAFATLVLAVVATTHAAETRTSDQTGEMREKRGEVRYQALGATETVPGVPQKLNFGDTLYTKLHSEAAGVFEDGDDWRIRQDTKLTIVRKAPGKAPAARIEKGSIYIIHRAGPDSTPVETPQVVAVPKGTEFCVTVDPARGETVFTMFDGEVLLRRGAEEQRVPKGFQGVVTDGRPIEVRPILQAQNIVQWWIHYPGVLDADELALADDAAFAASLRAYREGDLRAALEKFPGHPAAPRTAGASAGAFYAGLLLGAGDIEPAEALVERGAPDHPAVRALRIMLDAVAPPLSTNSWRARSPRPAAGGSASELLAVSYAHQAAHDLEAALRAARAAVAKSPRFAFAHARVAELEFSFRRTRPARAAVDEALKLGSLNAQAHALNGFLLAADNRFDAALAAFGRAIELDSSLANGWLGRGLVRIRRGDRAAGRSDLALAAVLEPTRSLLRSYAGKAAQDAGNTRVAAQELDMARALDPNDPTPWLYAALLHLETHRVNEAVDELEKSIRLNDNRALFRSRLSLDEDRAVRGANLARVYERAGLDNVSFNEAARAVSYDRANFSAHQFMADNFDRLRDPTRFNLRYETPWFGELLLANLLSPVGATPLSQHVSQQEYSRLFARDRAGLSSDTLVRSDREIHELVSQYGNFGNTAWALDLDYQHNDGVRRNNQLDRKEWYTTIKQQFTPQDSALLLVKYEDYEGGDNFQYYDAKKSLNRDYHYVERERPIALGGWHHEWAPGIHTLLLGGRLAYDQKLTDGEVPFLVLAQTGSGVIVPGSLGYDVNYRGDYEAWTAELNQIFQTGNHTLTLGARYQNGELTGKNVFVPNTPDAIQVPFRNSFTEPADRVTGYAYYDWRIHKTLLLIGGVSYDLVTYPRQLRGVPVARGHEDKDLVAPKAGLVWTPLDSLTLRGAYAQSLGGVTLDQSYRLEPTHLAGFVQNYRTLFPVSLAGPVSAQRFETAGAALEWKLPTRTYVTAQFENLAAEADHTRGMLFTDLSTDPNGTPIRGTGTRQKLDFEERSVELAVSQLLGDSWSAGARYRFTRAELRSRLPDVPLAQYAAGDIRNTSDLHAAGVFLNYTHRCGFFAQSDFTWYAQDNRERGYSGGRFTTRDLPSDDFPQWNLALGWRFPRQRGDVTFGVLNLTGEDYRLSPMNFHNEMPHERVFYGRVRFRF
jgi:outer membrane receptor protein involved in Fe transport/Tfp pilus assembly protein PilF